ncbi:MAG: hypothetical protein WC073_16980, partial [Sterolibacterium sp.]
VPVFARSFDHLLQLLKFYLIKIQYDDQFPLNHGLDVSAGTLHSATAPISSPRSPAKLVKIVCV